MILLIEWSDWETPFLAGGITYMYDYFEDKEFLRRAQNLCSSIAKATEEYAREHGVIGQVFLVGSGGRNMITRDGTSPIDFDYNFNVIKCEDWHKCMQIKEAVRKAFNKAMRDEKLRDVQDSTSSLTSYPIYFEDTPEVKFSIDIGIVTMDNDGNWHRLIHQKHGNIYNDPYIWNEVRHSKGLKEKTKRLKVNNYWPLVREIYLEKKNKYKGDDERPSFICFIEAVNEAHQKCFKK